VTTTSLLSLRVAAAHLTLTMGLAVAPLRVHAAVALPPDTSPHRVSMVTVATAIDLELLDWNGEGPPILLLAGLGDTAHVFDQFALRFTDRFHVYGVTRRGFGRSGHPEHGYDADTLANDILKMIDHLKIGRVILVGHSIAGGEMTRFASTFPSRVLALLYLDAAYDRTGKLSSAPTSRSQRRTQNRSNM
jgi:pimeloyl-ACP methyl ester carboxylesterase